VIASQVTAASCEQLQLQILSAWPKTLTTIVIYKLTHDRTPYCAANCTAITGQCLELHIKKPLSSENHCKIDTFSCHYFFSGMVWSTAISISACLSVCSHIVKTTCLIISLIVCTCYTWLWPDLILMTWRILWMMLCFHTMVHIKWLGGSGHRQVTHPSVTHCHNDTDSPTTGSK